MPDRIHELLERNLQEVFGEGDANRRRAAIKELYTEDCVLYVPPGIFTGQEALDQFAGELRATHRISFTSRTACRRRCIMPDAWPGGPAHGARRQIIPEST